ncbi:hypothetical protein VYF65_003193 [Lysinibacillus irui]|uniref:hypothetical protein n=1 Tax=Lysinibacillus irui TaxID=2998077 RepID=UPI0038875BC3
MLIWWGFCSTDYKKLINLTLQKFEIRFRKILGKKCWFPFLPVVPHLIGVQIGVQKIKTKGQWAGAENYKNHSQERSDFYFYILFCKQNYNRY